MPLVPDRWLNVTRTREPRTRQVAVFGHTHSDSSSHREASRAPSESLRLPDGTIVDLRPANVAPSSVVEVWVERLDPALGEDFGWVREADAFVQQGVLLPDFARERIAEAAQKKEQIRAKELVAEREFAAILDEQLIDHIFVSPVLWKGSVTLPKTPGGETRYRLVIAEYEEYLVDDAFPYDRIPAKKDHRLVFVEHIELD